MANSPKIHIRTDGMIHDNDCRKRAKKGGDTIEWMADGGGGPWTIQFTPTNLLTTATVAVPAGGSGTGTVDTTKPLGKYLYHVLNGAGTPVDDPDIILET